MRMKSRYLAKFDRPVGTGTNFGKWGNGAGFERKQKLSIAIKKRQQGDREMGWNIAPKIIPFPRKSEEGKRDARQTGKADGVCFLSRYIRERKAIEFSIWFNFQFCPRSFATFEWDSRGKTERNSILPMFISQFSPGPFFLFVPRNIFGNNLEQTWHCGERRSTPRLMPSFFFLPFDSGPKIEFFCGTSGTVEHGTRKWEWNKLRQTSPSPNPFSPSLKFHISDQQELN